MLIMDRRESKDRRFGFDKRKSHTSQPTEKASSNGDKLYLGTDRRSRAERRGSIPRRKHERFKAQDFVFAHMKGAVIKVGQIIDISKAGFAFRYLDIGKRPEKSVTLDMIVKNNGFHLENLSFITKMDSKEQRELSYSSIPLRRRGGKFGDLSHQQRSQIEYFILNHAVGNP